VTVQRSSWLSFELGTNGEVGPMLDGGWVDPWDGSHRMLYVDDVVAAEDSQNP